MENSMHTHFTWCGNSYCLYARLLLFKRVMIFLESKKRKMSKLSLSTITLLCLLLAGISVGRVLEKSDVDFDFSVFEESNDAALSKKCETDEFLDIEIGACVPCTKCGKDYVLVQSCSAFEDTVCLWVDSEEEDLDAEAMPANVKIITDPFFETSNKKFTSLHKKDSSEIEQAKKDGVRTRVLSTAIELPEGYHFSHIEDGTLVLMSDTAQVVDTFDISDSSSDESSDEDLARKPVRFIDLDDMDRLMDDTDFLEIIEIAPGKKASATPSDICSHMIVQLLTVIPYLALVAFIVVFYRRYVRQRQYSEYVAKSELLTADDHRRLVSSVEKLNEKKQLNEPIFV